MDYKYTFCLLLSYKPNLLFSFYRDEISQRYKKMNKKTIALGLLGLSIVSLGAGAVSANMGFDQHNDVMKTALENGDYDAFLDEFENIQSEKLNELDEEHFMKLSQRFQKQDVLEEAIKNNDYETFQELTTKDVSEGDFEEKVERYQSHLEVEEAIENADYEAWIEATEKLPHAGKMSEIVTQEDFDILVALHEAKEEGDFEDVKMLKEELGWNSHHTRKPQKQGMKGWH
jgi:hypothetical protein